MIERLSARAFIAAVVVVAVAATRSLLADARPRLRHRRRRLLRQEPRRHRRCAARFVLHGQDDRRQPRRLPAHVSADAHAGRSRRRTRAGFGVRGFGVAQPGALRAVDPARGGDGAATCADAIAPPRSPRPRLWAALPVHVEPVAYYSALGDLLSLVCELGALSRRAAPSRARERAWPSALASLVLAALALGAKEMALGRSAAPRRRRRLLLARLAAATRAVARWRSSPASSRSSSATWCAHHFVIGVVGQGAISAGGVARAVVRAPVYLWAYVAIIVSPVGARGGLRRTCAPARGAIALAWLGVVVVASPLWRARRPSLTLRRSPGSPSRSVPVLHLVPLLSYYADRFALVPSVGLALAARRRAVGAGGPRAHRRARRGRARRCRRGRVSPRGRRAPGRTTRRCGRRRSPRSRARRCRTSNLGLALVRAHRPADALEHLVAAEAIDGKSAAVLVGVAAAHDALGHAAAAEAAARAAVAADERDARAHAILGSVLARRGDVDDAAARGRARAHAQPRSRLGLDPARPRRRGARPYRRRARRLAPRRDAGPEQRRLPGRGRARWRSSAAIAPPPPPSPRACLALRPDAGRCRELLGRAGSP